MPPLTAPQFTVKTNTIFWLARACESVCREVAVTRYISRVFAVFGTNIRGRRQLRRPSEPFFSFSLLPRGHDLFR